MSTISIDSKINLDVQAILNGVANLDNESLESFAEAVNSLLAKRKVAALSKQETILLKKINETPSENLIKEFRDLQQKNKTGKISKDELHRLDTLVENMETKDVERLESMILLANLWNISLDELRKRLKIKTPTPYVQ